MASSANDERDERCTDTGTSEHDDDSGASPRWRTANRERRGPQRAPRRHQARATARVRRGPTRAARQGTEEFKCGQCRAFIGPTIGGGRHRNHCPLCLHSRHVDRARPGDRASDCWASMAPIALRPPRRRVGDRPPLPRLRPGATQPPRRRRQSGVADPFAAGRAPDRAGAGGWHGIRRGYHDARYATEAPRAVARGVLTGRDRARGGGPPGPPLHGLVRSPWRLSQAAAATVVPRADVKKRSRRSAYSAAQHDQREACPRPGRTQSSFGSLAAS